MIFPKRGYISVKEQWVFVDKRLDVMNTYASLFGVCFLDKISFDVATNGEHFTRAKRNTVEIIKTLTKLRMALRNINNNNNKNRTLSALWL